MKTRTLVGALVAAGVIGGGVGATLDAPFRNANANPVVAAGVAAPAANPGATALPLTGFTELVKNYGPAVVNVSVNGTRKASASMPQIPEEFREFFRGFGGPMPRGDIPMRGQGSGFIVSPDGYILTNAHVVENADSVNIKLNDRREFKAKVVGTDKQTDVAVLKIDADNLPTVKLGKSSAANVGEWVVAIGSPFGFENSVTVGVVSAKGRSLPDDSFVPFIQTDVAVNPGNSGGPLFNSRGEVVAINSQIYTRTGGYQGISFSIPIEVALRVKDQIVETGEASHARLGIAIQQVNQAFADSFDLDKPEGALVSSVEDGGPADKAGLESGDIVRKIDGQPVVTAGDLPAALGMRSPGDRVELEIWRDGKSKTITAKLGDAGDRVASAEPQAAPEHGEVGLAVRPLQPAERAEAGVSHGLVVAQVSGPAAAAGIRPGDLLLAVNGKPVSSAEDVRELIDASDRSAALLIQRGGDRIFVPVHLG